MTIDKLGFLLGYNKLINIKMRIDRINHENANDKKEQYPK